MNWTASSLEPCTPAPPDPRSDTDRRQSWTGGEGGHWPGGFSPERKTIRKGFLIYRNKHMLTWFIYCLLLWFRQVAAKKHQKLNRILI